MPNILTDEEAADYVRTDATDTAMLQLLEPVDAYIKSATGRDWAADSTIHPLAKSAAGMILTAWYDDPTQTGMGPQNASNALMQLEAEALKYRKYVFDGLSGAGSIPLTGAKEGDDVIKLVGVYGASGSQTDKFESEISADGTIDQIYGGDLSANKYVVILKSPEDDITA
jgi:hypothetical protein